MGLENASGTELIFWMCAIFGSLFFVVRVMLSLVVGFGDDMGDGMDADAGGDFDVDAQDGQHTEMAFKLISLNTVSAFIMMFGWVGLTGYKQFSLGITVAVILAAAGGFFSMYVTAYLFKLAMKLTSEGANFKIEETVGATGSVYQKIPAEGKGVIHLHSHGSLRELDALSEGTEEIESFVNVEIVKVLDKATVVVKKVSTESEEG